MRLSRTAAVGLAGLFAVLGAGLAACGGAGTADAPAPTARFESFQAADVVFGQIVFAFNDLNQGSPRPGAGTLACPGLPAVGPLFLPDVDNHRVLGFAQTPIINNLEANFVLGQPDFDFADPGVAATAMRSPRAALVMDGRLLVADSGNHRVLVFPSVPDSRGSAPALVLGQSDFVTRGAGAGASGLYEPTGLSAAGERLVVTDRLNHRLLIWHVVPTASGAPADLVLGQADFSGGSPNRGNAVGPDTLFDPYGVWSDGVRLVVADRGNHRVLIWNTFPTRNGQPADVVLGQVDGFARTPGTGALGLFLPSDVHSNGSQLFVADAGNHRVLLWTTFPDADQATPQGVIGQSDFDHRTPNDADQDGVEDADSSAQTLKAKDGVLTVRIQGTTLLIGDAGNHRLLVFRSR